MANLTRAVMPGIGFMAKTVTVGIQTSPRPVNPKARLVNSSPDRDA